MTVPILRVDDLRVTFGDAGHEVLHGISLSVEARERLGIVGESGSGKSVTALAATRLLGRHGKVVGGSITLDGIELSSLRGRALRAMRGRGVAMIFQDPATALNPAISIGRQLVDVLRGHFPLSRLSARVEAEKLLARVGIDDPARRLQQYPHELSGGMRQRVMIALALACRPKVLIADEPTTALDVTVQARVVTLLRALCEQFGIALVFISHDLNLVAELCDRIVVMRDGHVVETGATEQIFTAPAHAYTRHLLASIPRRDSIGVESASRGKIRLELRGVSKQYPMARSPVARLFDHRAHVALDALDLAVAEGDALGIVGESGSGKTTLARLLVGLDAPSAGQVMFDGQDIARLDTGGRKMFRRTVQMVFQGTGTALNPRKTVATALREAVLAERPRALGDLMDQVRLPRALLHRLPHELSGGQRQRVGIARALARAPNILIADEPTSALDVSVQGEIIGLLEELRRDSGLTLVVISHDLGLVGRLCGDVIVMRAGRVVERGAAADVLTAPSDPYTRELLNAVPRGLAGRPPRHPGER